MSADGVGRLRLDGGRELRAALKAAEGNVQDLKDANKEAADVVADRARETAPVGPDPRHIADTIRTSGTAAAGIVRVGNARMPYGKPVHWGHRTTGSTPRKVAAQPWVYDAAVQTSARWVPVYESHIDDILQKIERSAP